MAKHRMIKLELMKLETFSDKNGRGIAVYISFSLSFIFTKIWDKLKQTKEGQTFNGSFYIITQKNMSIFILLILFCKLKFFECAKLMLYVHVLHCV